MMQNMSPEQMKQMTEMASKMDPNLLRSMGAQVPGANLPSAEDMRRAQEQMAGMSQEELKTHMGQAQRQMAGQQQYLAGGAAELKAEGNTLVGEKRYSEAKDKYLRAIDNIQSAGGVTDQSLLESCNLNLALCQLKLEDFLDCIETCDRILATADFSQKPAVKALYRRGAALCQLPGEKNLQEGYVFIKRANALSPQDSAIEAEYNEQRERVEKAGLDVEALDREALAANAAGKRPAAPVPASSSSKETPKIEELDDPEPEQTTPEPKAKSKTPSPPPQPSASSSSSEPKVTPQSAETVKELLQDKNALKSASDMMSGLSTEQLQGMTGQSKEQCEKVKEAMKQFNENPEMMNQVQNMMKNMSPEDMENMMKMQGKMMGGGGSSGSAGAPPPDPAQMMKDPEMVKTAENFVKNMSPDMVKEAMKGQGVEVSDRQAQLVTKALPVIMAVYRYFLHLKATLGMLFTKEGRLVLAFIILIIGIYTQYA